MYALTFCISSQVSDLLPQNSRDRQDVLLRGIAAQLVQRVVEGLEVGGRAHGEEREGILLPEEDGQALALADEPRG